MNELQVNGETFFLGKVNLKEILAMISTLGLEPEDIVLDSPAIHIKEEDG